MEEQKAETAMPQQEPRREHQKPRAGIYIPTTDSFEKKLKTHKGFILAIHTEMEEENPVIYAASSN